MAWLGFSCGALRLLIGAREERPGCRTRKALCALLLAGGKAEPEVTRAAAPEVGPPAAEAEDVSGAGGGVRGVGGNLAFSGPLTAVSSSLPAGRRSPSRSRSLRTRVCLTKCEYTQRADSAGHVARGGPLPSGAGKGGRAQAGASERAHARLKLPLYLRGRAPASPPPPGPPPWTSGCCRGGGAGSRSGAGRGSNRELLGWEEPPPRLRRRGKELFAGPRSRWEPSFPGPELLLRQ